MTFTDDHEFQKLLGWRTDIDLTCLALEIARDAYPQLDFAPTLEWIDARANELAGPLARATDERAALELLMTHIGEVHGIAGAAEAFAHPDGSFLHRVIETGQGIPISLSLLVRAVAAAAHLDLAGVSAPMHFLLRCETLDGPLFVDAFTPGRILDESECLDWLAGLSRQPRSAITAALEPAGPRVVALRMLTNLKILYSQQERWQEAWRVQQRLTALEPASYDQRRDLALVTLRANQPGAALELLKDCLKTAPAADRSLLQDRIDDAASQLVRWN